MGKAARLDPSCFLPDEYIDARRQGSFVARSILSEVGHGGEYRGAEAISRRPAGAATGRRPVIERAVGAGNVRL